MTYSDLNPFEPTPSPIEIHTPPTETKSQTSGASDPPLKSGPADSAPPSALFPLCSFHRPTCAVIHLAHIRANIEGIRRAAGAKNHIWAVVKADAYGHGMVRVAETCLKADANGLAVATVDEAITLRSNFPWTRILLLGPCFPQDADDLVGNEIETAVGDDLVARALSQAASRREKYALAHLKLDTGMGRFGYPAENIARIAGVLTSLPGMRWKGVFTHFAVSDEASADSKNYTQVQIRWLKRAADEFRHHLPTSTEYPMIHACNSGGILQHPAAYFDGMRPGVMLYGHLPDPSCQASIQLWPAMTLKTRIVGIRLHPTGSSLSYGRTYSCTSERRIAILPVGYADGYNRLLSNRGEVIIRGRRAPVRGRICMDQTLVDITEISAAEVGDEVILFGGPPNADGKPPLPVSEVASWMGTIPYEVTCLIGQRVPRVYEEKE